VGGTRRLVNAARQPSFEALHGEHAPRIERLCRLLLRDATEAQDVAQEVLLKLLQEQRAGRAHEAWDRWLTRVTVNACRDRRRSGWWRWWRDRHAELHETDLPAAWPTPEEALVGVETRRRIWIAFRQLSPRQQEVFALRHVEDLSTADVAMTLGLTEGSAKQHLFRAVRHLRLALRGVR
jgi:RNA polymerase sigma-70 factor (ECF subfamily)